MTGLAPEAVALLDALLAGDGPAHRALRAQIPHLRVTGRCPCPCASIDVDLDRAAVPAAPAAAHPAAEATVLDSDGQPVGGVLVFASAGYLSGLEVYTWQDEPITRFPPPDRLAP